MTYALLSMCVLLGVVGVTALILARSRRRPSTPAVAITLVVLVVLTAVFDTVMIAAGFFHYTPEHLLGLFIGLAPLEDFSYPIAGAILLPALWMLCRSRSGAPADTEHPS